MSNVPGIIWLSRGHMEDDTPYWAYVLVPEYNIEAFHEAHGSGTFRLEDYGIILVWDRGESPPEKLQQEMEQLLPINHRFVDEFREKLLAHPLGMRLLAELAQKKE